MLVVGMQLKTNPYKFGPFLGYKPFHGVFVDENGGFKG